jgi:hypothetical protein
MLLFSSNLCSASTSTSTTTSSTTTTDPAVELKKVFDKADKDDVKEYIDDKATKSEFEQYYILQKRSAVKSTDRIIWFGESDANKDKLLSF